MISYSKRYIYFVILGKDFRLGKKRQRKWFHFGGSKILRILGIDSLEIHIPKMRKLSNNVTLEIWLQFLQNGKITCTISILSSLVKGNNRFVFGFIALVGSIWHWTFCPQHSLHPRSILVCVSRRSLDTLPYIASGKVSVCVAQRFITGRELRSRDRFLARLISFSKFLFEPKIILNVHTANFLLGERVTLFYAWWDTLQQR